MISTRIESQKTSESGGFSLDFNVDMRPREEEEEEETEEEEESEEEYVALEQLPSLYIANE